MRLVGVFKCPLLPPPKGFIVELYQIRSTNGGQGAQRDAHHGGFCPGTGKGSLRSAGQDHGQPERRLQQTAASGRRDRPFSQGHPGRDEQAE